MWGTPRVECSRCHKHITVRLLIMVVDGKPSVHSRVCEKCLTAGERAAAVVELSAVNGGLVTVGTEMRWER